MKKNKNYKTNLMFLAFLILILSAFFSYPYLKSRNEFKEELSVTSFITQNRYLDSFNNGKFDEIAWKINVDKELADIQVADGKLMLSSPKVSTGQSLLVFNKAVVGDFKIGIDLDLSKFKNGKFALKLLNGSGNSTNGFRVDVVAGNKTSTLTAKTVTDGEEKVAEETLIENSKPFNLKVARIGNSVYFGIDKNALIVLQESVYLGEVTPEILVSSDTASVVEPQLIIDSLFIEGSWPDLPSQ